MNLCFTWVSKVLVIYFIYSTEGYSRLSDAVGTAHKPNKIDS